MDNVLYLMMTLFFNEPEHTEEQSTDTVTYTVVRKIHKKKRNDFFVDGLEIEEIHHHPETYNASVVNLR